MRDKTLTYFEESLEDSDVEFDRLYKAVNNFSEQLRRVAEEDKAVLEAADYRFDLNVLVGGQLRHDKEHKLYLVYPQGNWVEIGAGTPYCIIGESGYGKPILDRTLKFSDSIPFALKVGCLAFDSTRISAANVDFPIDVIIYRRRAAGHSAASLRKKGPAGDFQLVAGAAAAIGDRAALPVAGGRVRYRRVVRRPTRSRSLSVPHKLDF